MWSASRQSSLTFDICYICLWFNQLTEAIWQYLHIGSLFIGSILYADDIALLACSCYGLQHLINICNKYGMQWDIRFNSQKSQLACFGGNSPHDNIINLGDIYLSWSAQTKYLGCCFRGKQCVVDPSSFIGRFYGTFNNILNVMGKSQNEMSALYRIPTYSVILLCCIAVKLGIWVCVMRNVLKLRGTMLFGKYSMHTGMKVWNLCSIIAPVSLYPSCYPWRNCYFGRKCCVVVIWFSADCKDVTTPIHILALFM